MESDRFDELAKAVATERASRRTVIGGIFGAALAGLVALRRGTDASARCLGKACEIDEINLPPIADDDPEDHAVDCEAPCVGKGAKRCRRQGCWSYRAVDGGCVCGKAGEGACNDHCCTDDDCPDGHRCVQIGPPCCEVPVGGGHYKCARYLSNICVRTCRR